MTASGARVEEREQSGEKSVLRSPDRAILATRRPAKLHAERCREPVTRKKACLEASHGENVRQRMPEEHYGGAIWEMSVLVMDLSDFDSFSSTGLGVFLFYHRQLSVEGGLLMLAAPSERTRRILRLSSLERALMVRDTVEDAVLHMFEHAPDSRERDSTRGHVAPLRGPRGRLGPGEAHG